MGIGALTLTLAVLAVLAWFAFLINHSRIRRRREAAPPNLSPFLTDDALESRRLNKVLISALVASAVLAIIMPVYYLNESGRQVAAADTFDEIAAERGLEWFTEFKCGSCHGADGGGGGASFIEARSGISTTWSAPSLNDILFRYDESEVRHWIVFGRPGTPMPSWGIEGGGPLGTQQVDELLAYIEHLQIPQAQAVAAVNGKVSLESTRLAGADKAVAASRTTIEDSIAALAEAPDQYRAIQPLIEQLDVILTSDATCTAASAAALKAACNGAAPDADRDGVGDVAEVALNALLAAITNEAPPSDAVSLLSNIAFDPNNAFTTSDGPTPIPDADQLSHIVTETTTIERNLRLTVVNREVLLESALSGLDFVKESAASRRWAIDFETIAATGFGGNVADAQRGAVLFNAYCARCHTAGFSAGTTFTQEVGSGAFGPSLRDGRSVVQFPDEAAHLDFIINGSVADKPYGLNGIGRGWMPGFGTVLSESDLMLIVKFERSL